MIFVIYLYITFEPGRSGWQMAVQMGWSRRCGFREGKKGGFDMQIDTVRVRRFVTRVPFPGR
jgi:hypothetical protein